MRFLVWAAFMAASTTAYGVARLLWLALKLPNADGIALSFLSGMSAIAVMLAFGSGLSLASRLH